MKLFLFALLAFSIYLTSCQKEESSYTEVSGVVYDKGNPTLKVSNAWVYFEWREALTYGALTYSIDSVKTDVEGRYSLSSETPNEDLYIYANGPDHFPEGALTIAPNVQRGKKQTKNLAIVPHSWIRINIEHTGQYNYMNINRPAGSLVNFQVYSDTILYAEVYGNTLIEINTFKYLNGNQDIFHYSIQTIGHDTVDIAIEF